MVQAKPKMTLEEFIAYDDGTDTRYELEDGVLVEMPTESPRNTKIAVFLIILFVQMGIPMGRIGIKHLIAVVSDDVKAREPDLVIHSEASAAAVDDTDQAIVLPDMPVPMLVIEVVSPGGESSENYQRDYIRKRREYATRGIPEYWLIDSDRAVVTVLQLDSRRYVGRMFRGSDRVDSPTFGLLQLTAEQILRAGR